jgi:hypothetical protein
VAGHSRSPKSGGQTTATNSSCSFRRWCLREATAGDPEAAQQRLSAIENLPLLEIAEEAVALAKDLVCLGPLPEKAEVDALHIAIAVMNQVDYLLAWNCKHLANAALRSRSDAPKSGAPLTLSVRTFITLNKSFRG